MVAQVEDISVGLPLPCLLDQAVMNQLPLQGMNYYTSCTEAEVDGHCKGTDTEQIGRQTPN